MDSDFSGDDDWDGLETITSFDCEQNVSYGQMYEAGAEISTFDLIDGLHARPPVDLVDGSVASSSTTAPVSLLVSSLIQQLCSLLETDAGRSKELYDSVCDKLEQMRLIDSSWKMGEFDMMRLDYCNALQQLVRVAQGPAMLLPAPTNEDEPAWIPTQSVTMEWARYHKEFEQLSYIAGGGFGEVYRARNKLDGIVYAVKKVKIKARSTDKVMLHLSEVKNWASLQHVNIVPYKTAWLEPLIDSRPEESVDLSEVDEEEDEEEESGEMSNSKVSLSGLSKRREEEVSDSIVFLNSEGGRSVYQSSLVSCETTERMTTNAIDSRAVLPYDSKGLNHVQGNQLVGLQSHLNLKWAVLYIQMTECQSTLRTWLDERNQAKSFYEFYAKFVASGLERSRSFGCGLNCQEATMTAVNGQKPHPSHMDVVTDIFRQLINGLSYIHSREITHHDIKPGNIFISVDHESNVVVQLGDFGLACPRGHNQGVVGTRQYAAPEQLRGECNKKSDIYSLGVILMELLHCFGTEMERNKTVADAKRNVFTKEVPQQFRPLICQLLSEDAEQRPHAFDLSEIFSRLCRTARDPDREELQQRLRTQEEQIAKLRTLMEEKQKETVSLHQDLGQQLSAKDQQIEELRLKLASIEAQEQKTKKQVQAKHHETIRLKKKLRSNGSSSGSP